MLILFVCCCRAPRPSMGMVVVESLIREEVGDKNDKLSTVPCFSGSLEHIKHNVPTECWHMWCDTTMLLFSVSSTALHLASVQEFKATMSNYNNTRVQSTRKFPFLSSCTSLEFILLGPKLERARTVLWKVDSSPCSEEQEPYSYCSVSLLLLLL